MPLVQRTECLLPSVMQAEVSQTLSNKTQRLWLCPSKDQPVSSVNLLSWKRSAPTTASKSTEMTPGPLTFQGHLTGQWKKIVDTNLQNKIKYDPVGKSSHPPTTDRICHKAFMKHQLTLVFITGVFFCDKKTAFCPNVLFTQRSCMIRLSDSYLLIMASSRFLMTHDVILTLLTCCANICKLWPCSVNRGANRKKKLWMYDYV